MKQSTISGVHIDLIDPKPSDVNLDDIVWSLCRINRCNGHTTKPYSVGQHTIAMVWFVDALGGDSETKEMVLLHDMPEYVLGDMTAPVKELIGGPGSVYELLTTAWENAICEHFGVDPARYRRIWSSTVHHIDRQAYLAEAALLTNINEVEEPHELMLKSVRKATTLTPSRANLILLELAEEFLRTPPPGG